MKALTAIGKKIKEAFQDSRPKEKVEEAQKSDNSPLEKGRAQSLASLQTALKIKFKNIGLLNQALTHPSFSTKEGEDNARLEFLGDSVLGLTVSHLLYEENPKSDEGELTQWKSHLVSTKFLADLAELLHLEKFLQVGGFEKRGPAVSPSMLAATFEAVLGAIYLDGGFSDAFHFLEKLFRPHLKIMEGEKENPKGYLQELLQRKYRQQPHYTVIEESGPSHAKMFEVQVSFRGKVFGSGRGQSKKEAEKAAAREALEILGRE